MHFEQHTELDNLITMHDLRTSANKGSNDAYDVHTSLTEQPAPPPELAAYSHLLTTHGASTNSFPSHAQTPTVTFCSVHIYNVAVKTRDASAELLQFLHAKMRKHNVDFIGGDFNMSAFSTVSDVFSDPEFSEPGHSCLWGLGALDEQHRENKLERARRRRS